MDKEQWIQTNARKICDAIVKNYEENGHLYCSSYTTNDEITKSANKIMQICDDLSNGQEGVIWHLNH